MDMMSASTFTAVSPSFSNIGTKNTLRSTVSPEFEWPGDDTPDRASWSTRSMSNNECGDDSSDGVECPTCQKTFSSEHGVKIHHAQAHGESIAGVEVNCAYCDEPKRISPSRVNENGDYFCDPQCTGKWFSENRTGEDAFHWKGGLITVECDNCGSDKEVPQCYLSIKTHHFCDRACKGEWWSEMYSGESHPNYSAVDAPCDWCGSTVTRKKSVANSSDHTFCDYECYGSWRSEHIHGPDHPQWLPGEATYGRGFDEDKKEFIRERDGRKCQECGRTESEHTSKFGRKHHVHHIQKARTFDDDGARNAPENLVTLCMGVCHLKWEKMSPLRPQIVGDG